MKMKLFLTLLLCAMPLIATQKMPKTKLSHLKTKYNQLAGNPSANQKRIRDILTEIKSADPAWAQDRLAEFEAALAKQQGVETRAIPKILPGVPTPAEYMPKPEPEMAGTSEEEYYAKPPVEEAPSQEIPAIKPPIYEEESYIKPPAHAPAVDVPVEQPPAHEELAVSTKGRSTKMLAHQTKTKRARTS